MARGGWCSGPPGARLKCEFCRFAECDHDCAHPLLARSGALISKAIQVESLLESSGPDAVLEAPAGPSDQTLRGVIGGA